MEQAEAEKQMLDYKKLEDWKHEQLQDQNSEKTKGFNTHPTEGSIDLHQVTSVKK